MLLFSPLHFLLPYCTAWHYLTSPGCAHRSLPLPAAHTCVLPINTNCSSPARLPRRSVHGRCAHWARCLGTQFPRSFVTQPSPSTSSDNPWKLIFSTIILIDCVSFDTYMYSVYLGSITAHAFVTVSVYLACFKCLFTYLLTYLLTD